MAKIRRNSSLLVSLSVVVVLFVALFSWFVNLSSKPFSPAFQTESVEVNEENTPLNLESCYATKDFQQAYNQNDDTMVRSESGTNHEPLESQEPLNIDPPELGNLSGKVTYGFDDSIDYSHFHIILE